MSTPLLAVEVRSEQDVVLARQRARQVAGLLGLEAQDQARVATAVSEIARNVHNYAGRGRVEFRVDQAGKRPALVIVIADEGPGIGNLETILAGQYESSTGMGLGLLGAKRLMDGFEAKSAPGAGTRVTLRKILSPAVDLTAPALARLGETLVRERVGNPLAESQEQNRELLRALEELRSRQAELATLNRELEDTNRGVVALYAELDEKADHLRRADEMKSRFLSHMSHEFRTPLNSILAISRLLLERMDGDLEPEQEKQVGFIRKAAQDLGELVNDLLDLAKVEAGKTDVRVSTFHLASLFGALRGMMRPLVTGDQVRLVFEEVSAIPLLVTDEAKVAQILRNFVSNALKFTERGEIRVRAELSPDGRTARIAVADTGIGIAPEDVSRLFSEFGQLDSGLQRKVKGTGLGLALSKRLAELLGGAVSVESEAGRGSTFTLSLPLVYPGSEERAPAPPRGALRRAVLVDDDEAFRYVLRTSLAPLALEVIEAADGEEGLRTILEAEPDIAFLDLNMPKLDGISVLTALRGRPETQGLPVILVTSQILSSEEDGRVGALGAPVLSKDLWGSPGTEEHLTAALQEAGFPTAGAEGRS